MHEKWTKLCTASNYYYRRPEGISLQSEHGWKVPAVKASMMARLPQCSTLLRGLRPIFSDRTIKFYPGNRYSRINAHPVINFYFDYWLRQLFRSIRSIIRSRGTNIYVFLRNEIRNAKALSGFRIFRYKQRSNGELSQTHIPNAKNTRICIYLRFDKLILSFEIWILIVCVIFYLNEII